MGSLGWLVIAVAMPTAAGYSVVGLRRLRRAYEGRRPALASDPPMERLTLDLRRLHLLLTETENAGADLPSKHQRCIATRAAYLDALGAACRHLEIPAPAGRPVPRTEIYRVEADLRRCGVDVRPVG